MRNVMMFQGILPALKPASAPVVGAPVWPEI